jgi:hypothetical protein
VRKPVAISSASLLFHEIDPTPALAANLEKWNAVNWSKIGFTPSHSGSFPSMSVIIPYNSLEQLMMEFHTENINQDIANVTLRELRKAEKFIFNVILKSIDGRHFASDVFEIKV